MSDDCEYDPVYDRLDELMYGGEPDPPDCGRCNDSGDADGSGWCPGCHPSPRQRRRARHRRWQALDRASRDPQVQQMSRAFGVRLGLLVGPAARQPFDSEAPF